VALTIPADVGRAECLASLDAFLDAIGGLSEYELFASSRCHGWTRLDVVVHVSAGLQEILSGLVSPAAGPPTVHAASYWRAFAEEFGGEDPVEVLTSQRRRGTAYARPAAAVEQLRDVAAAVERGIDAATDRPCLWQGHVFTTGDFLAVWAVEHVVHHLDLLVPAPPPAGGLALARATVEALLGEALPREWDDETAVLLGAGRLPVPEPLADRLPVLG
jgi:uncharacterized protein (TIGR03083 family)